MTERRVVQLPKNLDKDGWPECPECGCNASEVTHTYTLPDGRKRRRRECDHCGLPFFTIQEREHTEPNGA